jgi:SAM-dependent methyltransferase
MEIVVNAYYPVITGYQPGAIVMAAAEIGLLDALADGPAARDGLAARLSVSERGLDALLSGLRAIDVLDRTALADGMVQLTNEAVALVRTGAGGLGRIIRKEHGFARLWTDLATHVRTGVGHYPGWRERGRVDPDGTAFFLAAINDIAEGAALDVLAAADFGDARTIVDVGGGGGAFATAIAAAHPDATITILELAATAPITRSLIGDPPRVTVVEGDAARPALGAQLGEFDAAFVSHVLHDAPPDEAEAIVHEVAAAVKPGGLVVINDTCLTDPPDDHIALFDVMMIVETPAGRCHPIADVIGWMTAAGLTDIEIRPLAFGQILRAHRPAA